MQANEKSSFAMLFEEEGGRFTFWLGKVQRLIRHVGPRKVEYRQPVDLDNYDGPIFVVAMWYTRMEQDGEQDSYELGAVKDLVSYDIRHVITPVHLGMCESDVAAGGQQRFALTQADKAVIEAAVARMDGVGADTVVSEPAAAGTQSRKRSRAKQQMDDDGGRIADGGTSSRGRQRQRITYSPGRR
jgi:hypothetical protein